MLIPLWFDEKYELLAEFLSSLQWLFKNNLPILVCGNQTSLKLSRGMELKFCKDHSNSSSEKNFDKFTQKTLVVNQL